MIDLETVSIDIDPSLFINTNVFIPSEIAFSFILFNHAFSTLSYLMQNCTVDTVE